MLAKKMLFMYISLHKQNYYIKENAHPLHPAYVYTYVPCDIPRPPQASLSICAIIMYHGVAECPTLVWWISAPPSDSPVAISDCLSLPRTQKMCSHP